MERATGPAAVDHVVLIVVDTLRADAVACYGGDGTTPNMDRLAAGGLRFADARSHIPITGPSHASLFTSRWPSEHGVRCNAQVLPGDLPTMAELLRAEGFATAAFVSLGVLKGKFGLARGFDTYVDRFAGDWYRDADDLNRDIMEFLSRPAPPRGLLWVHYSDPHEPYTPPGRDYPVVRVRQGGEAIAELVADGRRQRLTASLDSGRASLRFEAGAPPPGEGEAVTLANGVLSEEGRMWPGWGLFPWVEGQGRHDYVTALPAHLEIAVDDPRAATVDLTFAVALKFAPDRVRAAYLSEVDFVDRAIGELLSALERSGWLEGGLVVLASDHGEGLGDHGLEGHIHQLYDSLLQVPLILWSPGIVGEGEVDARPVGLVDVLPTVLRLTGTRAPAGLRGRDLLAGSPGSAPGDLPLVAQTFAPEALADLEAIVLDGHKLIRTPGGEGGELYALRADAGELDDLAGGRPDLGRRLGARLDRLLDQAAGGTTVEAVLDDEERRQLEALGYRR